MALHHLLYRCPECGHDPTTPAGRGASCEGCGAHFERGLLAEIQVRKDSVERTTHATELIDAIEAWERKDPSGGPDGSLEYASRVLIRRAVTTGVVYERGRVAGFFEEFGEPVEGVLELNSDGIALGIEEQLHLDWTEVVAVQTASKSLQINTRTHGLFDMKFPSNSPRRWERLIHRAMRWHYAHQGLHIREFQPRIVTVAAR